MPMVRDAHFTVYALTRFLFEVPHDVQDFMSSPHWSEMEVHYPWEKQKSGALYFKGEPTWYLDRWPMTLQEFDVFSKHYLRRTSIDPDK